MRFSCLVLALLSAVRGQAQSPNVAGRISDLNYIATQVPNLDPYFFDHLDRTEFQRAVDALNARIATASDAGFSAGLAQLLAMAGDAHTSLYLGYAPVFPLKFRWLSDGVFVTAAAPQYAQALGARLTAIGGMPIDQVAQRLSTVISHENDQAVHSTAEQYLRSRPVLEGLGIVARAPTVELTFRTLAGDEFTLQAAPEAGPTMASVAPDWPSGTMPAYLQSQPLHYWSTYSNANRLLYFKYNSCSDMATLTFASFAASFLQTMDANPIDTLVFDFRGNGGGSNMLWQPVLTGFQQRLPKLLSNPNFRVYVALDKGSFSSAIDNAMKLKNPALLPGVDLSKVIQTIGEPPGQPWPPYGNTVQFTLAGSQATGWYSTSFFARPAWVPDSPELVPDIPIALRSTDYFARFDPVMAAILARSGGAPAAPSGDVVTVNGASFRPGQGLAPGSIAAVFGNFPTTPDELLVAGMAGQILAASRSQINVILPNSILPGPVTVSVRAGGKGLASGQATISSAGPGIFVLPVTDPSQPGAVANQDHSVNSISNRAAKGSVVELYATGCGAAPETVQVFFGDIPAQAIFSGIVLPGLCQINVQVPGGVAGQVPVFLAAGNIASNGITLWVE